MNRDTLIAEIRSYLLSRRETLRRYLAGELSNIGSDDDEESQEDEAYFVMAASEAKELELINAAIERMRQGSYGTCEECGQPIGAARLEALPCAALCIDCQRVFEQSSGRLEVPNSLRIASGFDSEFAV